MTCVDRTLRVNLRRAGEHARGWRVPQHSHDFTSTLTAIREFITDEVTCELANDDD